MHRAVRLDLDGSTLVIDDLIDVDGFGARTARNLPHEGIVAGQVAEQSRFVDH